MRKISILMAALLLVVLPVIAQEATPEMTDTMMMDGEASVSASDQVVLNGIAVIESVTLPADGWVAIHADDNGEPGHVVGIAQAPAGTTENVLVVVDGAMSTPVLHVEIHEDTGQIGVYEHSDDESLDRPFTDMSGEPVLASISIAGLFAFDQQVSGVVVVASSIMANGGWIVVHTDEAGQPGPVLGQTLVPPGTHGPVLVPITLAGDGPPAIVYPMLHVDDGEIGVYEFGTVEGADNPIQIDGVVAYRPINLTDAPVLILANGTPISSDVVPSIIPGEGMMMVDPMMMATEDPMMMTGMATEDPAMLAGMSTDEADMMMTGMATEDPAMLAGMATDEAMMGMDAMDFTLAAAYSPGAGFVDVHSTAPDGTHPNGTLGHTALAAGENLNVLVALMGMPDMPITSVVFPMLHLDTDGNGVYQYNKVVGVDLPIVYNGAVVVIPVRLGDTSMMSMDATAEAMDMMTAEATMDMSGATTTPAAGATTAPGATATPGANVTPAPGTTSDPAGTPAGEPTIIQPISTVGS